MSIINNAYAGSHIESLFLLDRMICEFSRSKPEERLTDEQIKQYCVPENLLLDTKKEDNGEYKVKLNPAKKIKETLAFWKGQGLWDSSEEGLRTHTKLDTTENLPARLLKLIASKEYDLLHGSKIEPLLRYITLILAMDKYTFVGQQRLERHSLQELVASVVLKDKDIVGRTNINDSETKCFFEYAHLLGFLEQVEKDVYFVDPTRALKVLLEAQFTQGEELLCTTFLVQLNQGLPIFDQGEYRRLIEDNVVRDNDEWTPDQGIRLSASLSVALYRLRHEGLISYRMGSDSVDRFHLTLPTGDNTVITHISYQGIVA